MNLITKVQNLKNINILKSFKRTQPDIPIEDRKFILVLCFTESSLNYDVKHSKKSIEGKICGVDKLWIDEIPEINQNNINSLYAGNLVFNFFMDKYKDKKISLIKYKGIKSKSKISLATNVIKLENKLK